MPRILVATGDGLRTIADSSAAEPAFVDRSVTAVGRDGAELWAIVDRAEIWHAPAKDAWRLVTTIGGLEATCLAMTDALHVGSSEARLFRLVGDAVERVTAFDEAAGRSEWFTPWGGPPATRSITEWDDDVYVNVHVGGIVHTADGGRSWNPTIDIDADVHQVATAEGSVLAACARGLATSTDRGSTWTMRSDGLDVAYSRAVAGCGATVLVSASSGPRGGRAAVYRGALAGGSFERCATGLPAWFDDNIDTYCLDALNDGTFAAFGTSDGRLFGSDDAGVSWQQLSADLAPIHHVLVLPD